MTGGYAQQVSQQKHTRRSQDNTNENNPALAQTTEDEKEENGKGLALPA